MMSDFYQENRIIIISIVASVVIALVAAFLPSSIVLGVLIILTILILSFYSLQSAFFVMIILALVIPDGAGVYQYFSLEIGGFNIRALEIILGSLLISWVIQMIMGRYKFKVSICSALILIFLAYLGFSVYIGMSNDARLTDVMNDLRGMGYYIVIFLALSIFSGQEKEKDKKLEKVSESLVLGSAIFAILFFIFYYLRTFIIHTLGLDFPDFGNRFNFRNTSIFFIPVAFCLNYLFQKIRGQKKAFYLICLILIIGAALISGTRTLWAAILLTIILGVLVLVSKKSIKLGSLVVVIVLCSIFILGLSQLSFVHDSEIYYEIVKRTRTFEDIWYDASYRFRVNVSAQALEEIKESPVFGMGLGVPIRVEHAKAFSEIPYIDNSWITLVYKTGLIGGGLFLAIWIAFIVELAKAYRLIKNENSRSFLVPVIVVLPGIILFSLSTVMLINYQATLILGSLMGIVGALYLKAKAK